MARGRRTGGHHGSTKQRDAHPALGGKAEEKRSGMASGITPAELNALVSEATVDCHDEEEQLMGLFNMIEENLALPFHTSILGAPVMVKSVEEREDRIVAICTRGGKHQAVSLLDLPLPSPPPLGAEWIEAYRHWSRI
jgi:hypothetical protein